MIEFGGVLTVGKTEEAGVSGNFWKLPMVA